MSAQTTRVEGKTASEIDLDEAEQFLAALAPGQNKFEFQTFDENPNRSERDKRLTRSEYDSLANSKWLKRYNRCGAGIFVAINATDGEGRMKENVTAVRALILDLDGAPLEPVYDCKLPPHIIVETSEGKYHVYWRVEGLPLDEFKNLQRGLAKRFDGDPAVATLERCTRLPGFFHCKDIDNPFRTRIVEINDLPSYSSDQIRKEFRPIGKPHKASISSVNSGTLVLDYDAPLESAREFVAQEFTHESTHTLRYYRGGFYGWRGSHYEEIDPEHLRSLNYQFLETAFVHTGKGMKPFNPNRGRVNAVVDALKAAVGENSARQAPFWLADGADVPADDLIAFKNGLLDVETLDLLPHTPRFFTTSAVPFDYDPDAPKPKRWYRFLRELWPDDKQSRRTLAEIFGLMLLPDTSFQKIFMVVGPRRSGKGTIARVLTAMVGKKNVANPTMSDFSANFGLQALIDKRVAIISDARIGGRLNTSSVADRLLPISGEDSLQVDRKYLAPWTGRLGVRFLILTNELPRIADVSRALASRFIVLTLEESFLGREDRELTDKLLEELPGILNWSLRGQDWLYQRGCFRPPEASWETVQQLEDLASPVGAFVRECCEVDRNARVNVKRLYNVYVSWCQREGHQPSSNVMFGRNLKAVVPKIRPRNTGADRFYEGVALNAKGRDLFMEPRGINRHR